MRNMLLFRKEKKHHDFMEKSKHSRSRVTEREGSEQKHRSSQNRVRRHSEKFQENRRNKNKMVRPGKNTKIKYKGTHREGSIRVVGNLLQN